SKGLGKNNGILLRNIIDPNEIINIEKPQVLMPIIVEKHIEKFFEVEKLIMSKFFNASNTNFINSYNQFFLKLLVVPPNRYRPCNRIGSRVLENKQNTLFK